MSEHVLEHLSAYLDGALGAPEKERFRAHLAECPSCASRLDELAAVDTALRDLPSLAPDGYFDELPSRLRNRLSAARPPQRRLLQVPLWAMAAAAALLVGVLAPLTLLERSAAPDRPSAQLLDRPAASAVVEADKLDQAKAAEGGVPPTTIASVPMPAATAAPGDHFRQRDEAKPRALASTKAEPAPSHLEEAGASRVPAAPPPQPATVPPAAGFATPPRQAEPGAQQSGPRANQQAELRKQEPTKPRADAQAESPEVGRRAQRAMETKDAEAPAQRALSSAEKKRAPEPTAGLAATTRPVPSARYRELQAREPRGAGEARALREAWRRFSTEAADLGEADEARVRVIEMGFEAWRLEKRPEDRSLAEKDAAAYLARADARQSARVRSLLASAGR